MIKKIQNSIKKHLLIKNGQTVLIAVSGGADSVSLLYALKELSKTMKIRLAVAHLNHCMRGKEADKDADFVEKLAQRLKLPFAGGRSNVPALARRNGISLEMAGRKARYRFLARAAKKLKANVIATAHTADDQAETVLLKLVRGSGPRGLSGVSYETVLNKTQVVRPLLDVTRVEIEDFLRSRKIKWREDKSNKDISFLRNRVRHKIIPMLESELNPKIKDSLIRTAEIIREEDQFLDDIAGRLLSQAEAGKLMFHEIALPLLRRVLRSWLVAEGVPAELIQFDAIDRIDALLQSTRGTGEVNIVGNWIVKKRYGQISVEQSVNTVSVELFKQAIELSGETIVSEAGLRIISSKEPGLEKPGPTFPGALPARASLSCLALGRKKVFVRSWQPGDRISPMGMQGSKKLKNIFIDAKIPAEQRQSIPVFECAGEVIWVPGYRVARGWEVHDRGKPNLQLLVERI